MTTPGGYQNEIYLQGLADQVPPFTTDATRLAEAAKEVLAPGPYWYVAGGAGSGATVRANREAFDRWRIVPRMLRDATHRDTSTSVLGVPMPSPVVLGPVGVQSIVHEDGELATARAAAALGIPMVMSTASSHTIEDVAAANGAGHRWYQLYWPNDPDLCASILNRAAKAGFTALVVTLDTWTLAWRPRDLDAAYLPFIRAVGTANYFSDPVFQKAIGGPVTAENRDAAIMHWVANFSDPRLTWDDLAFLREHWDGPILLKGVQHPDDARRAVEAGMDGVVVSNHGGRQVDGAIGSLDALPGVVAAVGDQTTVLFDSGV